MNNTIEKYFEIEEKALKTLNKLTDNEIKEILVREDDITSFTDYLYSIIEKQNDFDYDFYLFNSISNEYINEMNINRNPIINAILTFREDKYIEVYDEDEDEYLEMNIESLF